MQVYRGCETADHPRRVVKIFDGSLIHCVWSLHL